MDGQRFDGLTRDLASSRNRRQALKLLAGGTLGAVLARFGLEQASAQEGVGTDGVEADRVRRCRRNNDCRQNEQCCNRRCRDVLNDDRFCGDCNTRCADNEICRNGACFETCLQGRPGVCDLRGCGDFCGCNPPAGSQSGVCSNTSGSCNDVPECETDRDCRDGKVCIDNGCCPGKPRVCLRACSTRATASLDAAAKREGVYLGQE